MEVTLKKLKLSYFKGIKSLEIDFTDGENFIHGRNEAGKTTVFDSVWFLFFGKDSAGRSDFTIKTLDSKNKAIEKVDHSVQGTFLINGSTKTFKRTYQEQWSKTTNSLTGHTTNYEVDGYPVRTEKEFKETVEQFFKEDIFKLLTSPIFFNSMKPADRRAALISLVPEITDSMVFQLLPAKAKKSVHVQQLEQLLSEGKKLEQIKLKTAQDKKLYREEKDAIPGLINEATISKPVAYEFGELQEIINEKKKEIAQIDQMILDANNSASTKNKAIQEWQNRIFELKTTLQKLEFQADQEFRKFQQSENAYPQEVKDKIDALGREAKGKETLIGQKNNQIDREKSQIETVESVLARYQADREELVKEWEAENAKQFTWNGDTCTACNRPLEGALALDAEEKARSRFNTAKNGKLQDISAKGKATKGQIDHSIENISNRKESIRTLQTEIQQLTEQLEEAKEGLINLESAINEYYSTKREVKTVKDFLSPDAVGIQSAITELESNKPQEVKADTSELESNKNQVQTALEELQKALGNKETIDRINKRIEELKAKELSLADMISQSEGLEEACFTFSKSRMEQIESAINEKFDLVRFKMFETLVNGNEVEICETIYKGVPFQDLNTAGKIQSGLDIINALSRHHETYLPIFIDNRESATWVPDVKSQIINLVVDPFASELTVSQFQKELIEK